MHKLMCTFMTPMKKKIPDRNLDTSCPAGIPCKYDYLKSLASVKREARVNRETRMFRLRVCKGWTRCCSPGMHYQIMQNLA